MFLLSAINTVYAQENTTNPIYIVQSGDNLTTIAEKFGISVQELIDANHITDSNLVSEGMQLVIPGITGISGVLTTTPVEFGETFLTILRRYRISQDNFQKLNSLTSPAEIYIGSNLILPKDDSATAFNSSIAMQKDDSLLEESVRSNQNPWYLSLANSMNASQMLPNDILFFYSATQQSNHSTLSKYISKVELTPLPAVQGHTSEIRIFTDSNATLSGSLGGNKLNFFRDPTGQFYYALQGINAMAQPGLMSLDLSGQFDNGDSFSAEQMVLMKSGNFIDEKLSVDQATIDVNTNEAENIQVAQIVAPVTPERMWDGKMRFPVDGSLDDNTIGFSSGFGNRRSYNNGQYHGFHGGLDFLVVVMSYNAYASASGTVVYTGKMEVRGNTLFIDHGQGIYTGYAHLKEIDVKVGDHVDAGQLVGLIGATGRVTGPHLHWDIWANGNAVDPFDWINNSFP